MTTILIMAGVMALVYVYAAISFHYAFKKFPV